MNDTLNRLLDLQTLRWGADGVRIGFERPMPAWAWVLIAAAALGLALWSYSRLTGPKAARLFLGAVRALLLVAVAVLIAGPRLEQQSESVERDWILVLVDRSASMTIADVEADGRGRLTRDEQARAALARAWPAWGAMARERVVVWLGFDAGVFDLSASDAGVSLGDPGGQRTQVGASVEQALARAAARPLAAVVVLSDGRSSDQVARNALRRLQADRVPVYSVALGSEVPIGDLAVRRVDAPGIAFVRDVAPVRVDIERVGGTGAARATVRLVEKSTGIVLDEREVSWTGAEGEADEQSVVLTTSPEDAGTRSWAVEVLPEGPDLIAANNASEFAVELVDRPMRVLFVDGYPRWEQRYLKNLLIRESSIVSSTLILSPDRRYIQEGDIEIDALPQSPEEWAEFDAVILGDVRPDVFTDEQLAQLREHVARRGAGLVWIGGPGATPSAWWESPLADLIPFQSGAYDGGAVGEPVLMARTPSAERLGVLQLGESAQDPWPAALASAETGWSLLQYAQRIDPGQLKPATEILATGAAPGSDESWPLVMSMRFGAGRALYVATDETWRWRYGRGEQLPERFWVQMVRLLGRESLSRSGRAAILSVSPRRAEVDQPVRVAAELLDQMLADEGLPSVAVRLTRRASGADDFGAGAGETAELVLRREQPDGRVYSAVWLPPAAGVWEAVPTEPLLTGLGLSAEAQVSLPDAELRHPETDFGMLTRLSEETGGEMVSPAELGELPDRIPNRRVRLLNEVTEPLWDTPMALLVVVSLLTVEWVGRRVIRLI